MKKSIINRKKLQLDVCRAILDNNSRCRACTINNNEIAVTVDGYRAYVFGINECVFDISKIPTEDGMKPLFEDMENDTEITASNELYNFNGKTIEKYVGQDIEMFVDKAMLTEYKDCRLYANSARGRILAKDYFGRIIGLFLPIKFDYEYIKRGTNR